MSLGERREAGEHAEDATAEPAGATSWPATELRGLWTGPAGSQSEAGAGAAMLYLYGGGYMLGSPASRRKTAGHLAVAAGVRVLVPTYRLAPEHPFPAAVEDAVQAYRWLLEQGVAPSRLVVAGDFGRRRAGAGHTARSTRPRSAHAGRGGRTVAVGRSHLRRR